MFITYFLIFLKNFSKNYTKELISLTIISTICGFLEFFGLALVFPLITIILSPTNTNIILIKKLSTITDNNQCMLILCLLIVSSFIFKNLFMIFKTYYQFDFLKKWQNDINAKILQKYLYSSFEKKLNIPPKFSLFQVWQISNLVFNSFISTTLNLLSNAIILSIILIFLICKFKLLALTICIFFLMCGLLQNNFFKTKGRKLQKERLAILSELNNNLLSTIKNFKDIKIFGKENYFYTEYKKQIVKSGKIENTINFYNTIPQHIIEISIIIAIMIICYGIIITNNNSTSIFASLSLIGAAMFRCAPIINKLQSALNTINMTKPNIIEFFNAYEFYGKINTNANLTTDKFELKNDIKIKNLTYAYNNSNVIKNLSLDIKKGEFIGIIGKSGIGKTTFLDILMGLLETYTGEILADNLQLKEKTLQKWINSIGYVPQEITILPTTIAQNIAFGEQEKDINYDRISTIIEQTKLTEYISTLPNGINEHLSGSYNLSIGQKQRIGIARALYKNPEILFLDEITSALDLETENNIVNCLNALKGEKTIIAIAHRLSTLKKCDRIIYFKNNNTIISGTIDELKSTDKDFLELLNFASIDISN